MQCPKCGNKTTIQANDYKGNTGYYCPKCRYSWVETVNVWIDGKQVACQIIEKCSHGIIKKFKAPNGRVWDYQHCEQCEKEQRNKEYKMPFTLADYDSQFEDSNI
jgi:Zn-finger nucleic acid-binding protein